VNATRRSRPRTGSTTACVFSRRGAAHG
jgi:hypothetical protein